LLVYGALQALLTQQDAVKKVCETFQSDISLPVSMRKIREIRSDSIGHPTFAKKEGMAKANFIQRISLNHSRFTLMTALDDRSYALHRIDILELIKEQRQFLESVLAGIVSRLQSDEMAHRAKYRDTQFQDIFQHTGYLFSKIYESTRGSADVVPVKIHLDEMRRCLETFRVALEVRGEWGEACLSG
jgi:hypothetical protein